MTTLIANEIRKLRTVRGPWLLLAAGPVLVIVGVAGVVVDGADVRQPQTAIDAVAHAGFMSLLTLVFGITAVAGEYRHRTITDTYLATPRRGRVIAAKFAVYTSAGAIVGLVLAITAVVATAVGVSANGGSLDLSNSDLWRTLAGGVAFNTAFAAIGVSLGALITNLAAAIAAALAWIALVEGLVAELIDALEPWLPAAGGQALARLPGAPDISQWAGGLLLAGYALVFAAIALTTTVQRDVT
ncbi:ABC transporter permease [Kribbella sp. NPDC050820]|uniref:ABC transporter permease n=1 Tax=Kribbella sp. NPDC050820 TaxID=3155408 RepID=UPI0033CF049A